MDNLNFPTDPLTTWWPYVISLIVGLIACIKTYVGGMVCPTDTQVNGKVIVVTGASGGIGREICRELSKRGGNVIMCCRSLKKGLEAMQWIKKKQPNALLTLKKLDLTSTACIIDFAKCLDNIQVDVLINNAGVIFHPFKITDEQQEIHLATNYLGHFMLTHLLIENLKKSKQGRIINVCAGAYKPINLPFTCNADPKNYNPKEWFQQSKYAILSMTRYIPNLLKGTKITINAVNPGIVRDTEHYRYSIIMRNSSVRLSLKPWMWIFMKTPEQAAQTIIYMATDLSLANSTGKLFRNCSEGMDRKKENSEESDISIYKNSCEALKILPIQCEYNKK